MTIPSSHTATSPPAARASTALPDNIAHPTSSKCCYLLFNFVSSVVITFINDAIFSRAEFGYPGRLCLNGYES